MGLCRLDLVYTIALVAAIRLDQVTKTFGAVTAVDDVSLEIADGEFLVLVGPSGCGKSTLLRMIAGLEEVTGGEISIGDRDVTDLAPRSRDIAMVFQTYALYPHMTVRQNLGYGLKARRTPKPEIARRVAEVAELLGLDDLLERRPAQLSGGQRQRVAMGRAIVRRAAGVPARRAAVEPGCEAARRDACLARAAAPAARRHDRLRHARPDRGDDARTARRGDARRAHPAVRPAAGPLRQPNNLFIAAFIGSPAMNLVAGTVEGGSVRFGQYSVPVAQRPALERVVVGIRPESFEDAAFAPGMPTIEPVSRCSRSSARTPTCSSTSMRRR